MLINWFSPLPPARSGIAQNFAMQLLPALARRHELVLWTYQEQTAPEVESIARVARYDPANPPWRELNKAAISIYNLGNQPNLHGGIWQVSIRQPGIVILHDLCLHDFFSMYWVQIKKDRGSYLAALERWYGGQGWRAGEAFCQGGMSPEAMSREFPLTREATRGALGVIVHSQAALADLAEKPECPTIALDHPYIAAEESRYQQCTAARSSAPHPPYRLIVFGYLNRNRRLDAILEAIARMPEREQFHLDVCGQIWDESQIREQIDKLGLSARVRLSKFLPESLVEQKLSAADLAINLRYPSMGEASGSQLQFWDYGLPTLVTSTGWYSSLPEGTVAFVRPDREVEDIQTHLRAFLANPAAFRAMGEQGHRALAGHDPEKYVDALAEFAAAMLHRQALPAALVLAGRIGQDLTAWLDPAASKYLLDRASKEIAAIWGAPRGLI